MDGFLIHIIIDECKFRGKDFSNALLKKIQEIVNENEVVTRTDVKEEVNDEVDVDNNHEPVDESVDESEASDDESETSDDESETSDDESVSSGGIDRIYNVKSNKNIYNVVYDCKKERYICTCKDFKYHCDERNLMCKHIQKIDEFYEKGEPIEMYLNNGIEIIK